MSAQRRAYVAMFGGPDVPLTRPMRRRLTLAVLAFAVSGTAMAAFLYGVLLAAIALFDAVTR